MNILGIVAHTLGYGDASACLSSDGKIVGLIEEERFSRKRYDDSFPQKAIRYLLNAGKISGNEVDIVSLHLHPYRGITNRLYWVCRHPVWTVSNSKDYINGYLRYGNLKKELCDVLESRRFKIEYYDHHACHVAASFYSSPFQRAAFLTLDGSGEGITGLMGTVSRERGMRVLRRFFYPHSLGLAYSAICDHLGFSPPSGPGKIMGLAPYGDTQRFLPLLRKVIRCEGSDLELALDYFLFHKNLATPVTKKPWVSKKFIVESGLERREKNMPLEQAHMDLSAAIQARTNEVGVALARFLAKRTGEKNLCLGGGVTLNSVMNGAIADADIFEKIYLQPAAGDSGNALGSVYLASLAHRQGIPAFNDIPYAGPQFSDEDIARDLRKYDLSYHKSADIALEAAKAIRDGLIIGWFQGKMEFGPRALGCRSILADPQREGMRDVLNEKVKHREWFRPFAPAVTREAYSRYFTGDSERNRYMLFVSSVLEQWRKTFPSITHVDGTARVQSVDPDSNPKYYHLLKHLEQIHHHPVVLNTSFNDEDEPIVCTPQDAINCFLGTNIDRLFIGNYVVNKSNNGQFKQ